MAQLRDTKLTQEQLKAILHYDPETGLFHRYRKNGALSKNPAGSFNGDYVTILVDGHTYSAHSLAWFYATGNRTDVVSHENGDKRDNRIANLTYRPADTKDKSARAYRWS